MTDPTEARAAALHQTSHPSPGESSGFDAEVKRLADLIDTTITAIESGGEAATVPAIAETLVAAGVTTAASAEGLEEERLARALRYVDVLEGYPWDDQVPEGWRHRALAAAIASEYAALGPTADTADALNTTNATT